ncbi:MAG: Rieske 2Fe-2S domain-containing protein [Phycisphaeraceae bacterium]
MSTVTHNDEWTDLCAAVDVPEQGGVYVEVGTRAIAVLRVTAKNGEPVDAAAFRVMDDHCPHAGGSLSAGAIIEDCVICPWHAWPFDVNTGVCPDADSYRVKTYAVRIVEGRVEAKL